MVFPGREFLKLFVAFCSPIAKDLNLLGVFAFASFIRLTSSCLKVSSFALPSVCILSVRSAAIRPRALNYLLALVLFLLVGIVLFSYE